jgi:GDP-mannose transporter
MSRLGVPLGSEETLLSSELPLVSDIERVGTTGPRQNANGQGHASDPTKQIETMILNFHVPGLFGTSNSFASAIPILAYCGSSILMTLTNKGVLSGFGFTMNFLLLAIQCLAVVCLLEVFRLLGLVQHRPFRLAEAKTWFPVSVLLALMIYTGSKAVQYLSISLFTVFKNMTIIAIAYAERFFLNGAPVSNEVLLAFGLMILSSIIAGWADLTSDTGGFKESAFGVGKGVAYFWMFFNCVTSAAYAVGMRGAMKVF